MSYIFTPNEYQVCKNVQWHDVISKIDRDFSYSQHRLIADQKSAPTVLLLSNFYPSSIQDAFEEVKSKVGIKVLHIYASLGKTALTFGRHNDNADVLIVQSIGKMRYLFDDSIQIDMNPGDSLFIPKGVYHNPVVLEPRVTLSFSWQ